MAKQKIRIGLKAYDHRVIDQSAEKIRTRNVLVQMFLDQFRYQLRNQFTQSSVPCISIKISMKRFEQRTHKRLIDIVNPTPKTVDALIGFKLTIWCRHRNQIIIDNFRRWTFDDQRNLRRNLG